MMITPSFLFVGWSLLHWRLTSFRGVRLIIKSVVTIQPHGVRLFAPSVIAECLFNTELILPREELALA